MPANVVMRADIPLPVANQEKGVSGLGDLDVTASLREAQLVRDKQPLPGKDGPPLELVHGRRPVP